MQPLYSPTSRVGTDASPATTRRRRRAVAVGVTTAAVAASATAAFGWGATKPCETRSNAKVFTSFGDNADYFLAPNGSFEDGDQDWQLSNGAKVAAGHQPYLKGNGNLKLPKGSSAESRTMCVTHGENTVRLFVKVPPEVGATLHVEARVKGDHGDVAQTSFDVTGDKKATGWSPSEVLTIPDLLGGTGMQELTLTFSSVGKGSWLIDDVYVDPFKST